MNNLIRKIEDDSIDVCIQCEQPDTLVQDGLCFNCNYLNLKWDLESGVLVITNENLASYYQFMSDEIKIANYDVIATIFHGRGSEVDDKLSLDGRKLDKNWELLRSQVVGQTIFGVKDTLKPIKEYIAEIKACSQYKNYKTTLQKVIYDDILAHLKTIVDRDLKEEV